MLTRAVHRDGLTETSLATGLGAVAIALWSSFAVLTSFAASVPPFLLMAASFSIACLLGATLTVSRHGLRGLSLWKQPMDTWALSFAGIFAYHALFFFAASMAPIAQVNVINYLWPLLIVIFSSLGGRLELHSAIGALLGFVGTTCMFFFAGSSNGFQAGYASEYPDSILGYVAALGAAVVWAAYSVVNRRYAAVPTEMMSGVCGAVALAAGIAHLLFENTSVPTTGQVFVIVALGLGPTGAAFFAWDHATKHGRLPHLAALSYATPLLSTLLLIVFGAAEASRAVLSAALFIAAGATVASIPARPSLTSKRKAETDTRSPNEPPVE